MPSTLVLSDLGDETWGAVIEDGQVVELHVENTHRPGVAGNIYKGRVTRVLPGMQSAFVEVGLARDAFLHIADLPAGRDEEFDFAAGDEDEAEEAAAESSPRPRAALPPIEDLLREGQELVVQVAKEPI